MKKKNKKNTEEIFFILKFCLESEWLKRFKG